METTRLSLAGTAMLVLLGGSVGSALAQDEAADPAPASAEVLWELDIPSTALPDDFVKLVVEDWTVAPGVDTSDLSPSVLGNEALRGRGLVIESGELSITPATEVMLWRGAQGDPETRPAGETVSLGVGDAIFLPAVPDDEVEREAPLVFANPGSEPVTARSFHTHQNGGSFYGYLPGVTLGPWDMAGGFDPATREAMNGADITFRLTRTTAGPGSVLPAVAAPASGLYFVEQGDVELVSRGPGGEFTFAWPAGRNGLVPSAEGVEHELHVVSEGEASMLEFAALPQATASD